MVGASARREQGRRTRGHEGRRGRQPAHRQGCSSGSRVAGGLPGMREDGSAQLQRMIVTEPQLQQLEAAGCRAIPTARRRGGRFQCTPGRDTQPGRALFQLLLLLHAPAAAHAAAQLGVSCVIKQSVEHRRVSGTSCGELLMYPGVAGAACRVSVVRSTSVRGMSQHDVCSLSQLVVSCLSRTVALAAGRRTPCVVCCWARWAGRMSSPSDMRSPQSPQSTQSMLRRSKQSEECAAVSVLFKRPSPAPIGLAHGARFPRPAR